MRDCVFLVADSQMEEAFKGFFSRDNFWLSIGCAEFAFDPNEDLFVASGDNDPGLFIRGHELLRPYQNTHQYGVIVMDAEWDGSPGAEVIAREMTQRLLRSGWKDGQVLVIVIVPELENWIWQRSIHLAKAIGFASESEMLSCPVVKEFWNDGENKPRQPKKCLETVLELNCKPRSSALYRRVTSIVSMKGCTEASFLQLTKCLRGWFPL